jgi:predicted Rossmann fold flavoprotein
MVYKDLSTRFTGTDASETAPYDLLVIGGGPAGFFAAIRFAENCPNAHVLIVEKGARFLAKLLVSGGGRCNLTQHCFEPAEFVRAYPRGGRELLGPLHRFGARQVMDWFETRGVALKAEADGRVFPQSDSAANIVNLLLGEAQRLGIELRTHAPVEHIIGAVGGGFHVRMRGGATLRANKVVLATGGDARSLALAAGLGHQLQAPVPSLFTFEIRDRRLQGLAGVSVAQAHLRLADSRLQAEGPLLITHWGMSGPAVLRLSAWGARELAQRGYQSGLIVTGFRNGRWRLP